MGLGPKSRLGPHGTFHKNRRTRRQTDTQMRIHEHSINVVDKPQLQQYTSFYCNFRGQGEWIDLYDSGSGPEWQDGTPMNYTNFNGDPLTDMYDCYRLGKTKFKWVSRDCNDKYLALCQTGG